jgi:hypothetical protein
VNGFCEAAFNRSEALVAAVPKAITYVGEARRVHVEMLHSTLTWLEKQI